MEHIVPLSKGGSNRTENKTPCCKRCNSWRGNKSLSYFRICVIQAINDRNHKKRILKGYNDADFYTMIENIDHMKHYIERKILFLIKPGRNHVHIKSTCI